MTVAESTGVMNPTTWTGNIFNGEWILPDGGGEYAVREPATGSTLGTIGRPSPADVGRAAAGAAEAQADWAQAPFPQRAQVMRQAAQLFQQYADEIAGWLVREAGSIGPKAGFEIHVAVEECYNAAALAAEPYGKLLRSEAPRLSMARRLPSGVVGVIAPFNFPLILSIRSVAPALALGNAVILKPDPRTAVCGGVTLAAIFAEAGLPSGLLHVLPGGPEIGEEIIADPHVRVVSFTGSTAAGRAVGALAARHLKRAHLELGGNSAVIVLEDADIDKAAASAAWGSYFHQGQICMATSRHIVHRSVADEYGERLAGLADSLGVGNPATEQVSLGPIIDEHQRDTIHQLVTETVSAGARLAAGGTYEQLFYRPTVLTGVTAEMPAFQREIFGPVAPVTSFDSLDEAVRLAAGTEYGLSLAIMSTDVTKALELAARIPSGIVHINEQTVDDEAIAPFGGVGASGTGARLGGIEWNLEAFTETQWVTINNEVMPRPL